MMKSGYVIITAMLFALTTWGQNESKLIRKGNNYYEDGNFGEAERHYLKSQTTKNPTYKGVFNLGDVWYQQENYKQAAAAFDTLKSLNLDDDTKANMWVCCSDH